MTSKSYFIVAKLNDFECVQILLRVFIVDVAWFVAAVLENQAGKLFE